MDNQILDYLGLLFDELPQDEVPEFRLLGEGLPVKTIFGYSPMTNMFQHEQSEGYNVFVGVFSRCNRKPCSTNALWVDIDFKDRTPGILPIKSSVILDLQMSGIPPSFLVHSGHGIHAYWLLKERLYDTEIAKSLLKRLATHFEADRCYDVARILRVPGTYNLKDAENPREARLESAIPLLTYALEDIASTIIDVPSIPDKIDHIIKTGDISMFNDRSEADFAVIKELIRTGLDFDEIESIYQTNAIGMKGKYFEKNNIRPGLGGDYLQYTYRAAKRDFAK